MKKIILTLQFLLIVLVVVGVNSTDVKAWDQEYNRTVQMNNILVNGDFSIDDQFLSQGPRVNTYFEEYAPEADTVLLGGWITHFDFTGGDDIALTIVDGVATTPAFNTQTTSIFNYISPSHYYTEHDYYEALPRELDTSHRYYFSVITWADGQVGGGSNFDTLFYVSALGNNFGIREDTYAPTEPTQFGGIIETPTTSEDISVNYSSYCQYGCPANEAVNADNFILIDLTATFGDYEPTEAQFEAILLDNGIGLDDYIDSEYINFLDPDPDGDIKELDNLVASLYEEYTYNKLKVTVRNNSILNDIPQLNTVYGRTIPYLENVYGDYSEAFYLKDNEIYDSQINSTYGVVDPLDGASPVLNEVQGKTVPALHNVFTDYTEEFYLKTSQTYDKIINSTYGLITPLYGDPTLTEIQGLTLNQIMPLGTGSVTQNGLTITTSGNTLSISGTATTQTRVNLLETISYKTSVANIIALGYTLPTVINDEYYISSRIKSGSFTGTSSLAIFDIDTILISNPALNVSTLGTPLNTIGGVYVSLASGDVFTALEIEFMVIPLTNTPLASKTASELNAIIPTYFEGIQSISDFTLQSVGVNLFDVNILEMGTIGGTGLDAVNDSRLRTNEFIKVIQGEDYYLSKDTTQWWGVYGYSSNDTSTFISELVNTSNAGGTFTIPSGINYIRIKFDYLLSIALSDNIILNQGTTATAYTPYNTGTFTATADLLSVGDVRDLAYPLNDDWYKKQYVGRDVNDVVQSATTWSVAWDLTNTITFYKDLSSLLDYKFATGDTVNANVSLFIDGVNYPVTPKNSLDDNDVLSVSISSLGSLFIRANKTTIGGSTSGNFETYLQANDVTLTFELDDIVTTEIEYDGSLIQESNTTLIQGNSNFATEYDIDFVTSLDTSNTDYYYIEEDSVLINLETDYGTSYIPTYVEFENVLNYLDLSVDIDLFSNVTYIENFELQSIGKNEFNKLDVDTLNGYEAGKKIISTGATTTDVLYNISEYIPVSSGDRYITNSTDAYVNIYDRDYNLLNTVSETISFLIPENGVYVQLSYEIANINIWQLEKSSRSTYASYNTSTLTLTEDLLSLRSIYDRAYSVNDTWFKEQNVDIALNVAIGDIIDTTAIPTIEETTGLFYAIDTINNESQYGVYGDTLTLTGTATVYFELETLVTTEITTIGSLIQESDTTLIQQNNFATEYDIDFIIGLDTTSTDYYYSEENTLLFDTLSAFGSINNPTVLEFEEILSFYTTAGYVDVIDSFDYISDFTLKSQSPNLFYNELSYTVGAIDRDTGDIDPTYFSGRVTAYIELDPSTDYIINNNSGNITWSHGFYDSDYNYLGYASGGSATFTTPENTKFVRLGVLPEDYDTLQLYEGSVLLDSIDFNIDIMTITADLLSIKDTEDIAYYVPDDNFLLEGNWYKEQNIGIESDVAIGDIIDITAIPTIEETTGLFYAIDTVNNESQVGSYGDTLTLTGTATVYFELEAPVTTELFIVTGSLLQENNMILTQLNNLPTEYDIDFKTQASYLSTWVYEDVTENNPFYQYDDYLLSVTDESIVNITLKETLFNEFDNYPLIYIAKYDVDGNYIADIYDGYIQEFTTINVLRNFEFEYTLPITSANENMYMWIAYNGNGGEVLGGGYVAKQTSTEFNSTLTDVRSIDFAVGVNDTVYLDIADSLQYDHTTEDYIVDSTDPIIVAHYKYDVDADIDIVFFNENTEDTYRFSLEDSNYDFINGDDIDAYKTSNSFIILSASNELLGSMDYLLGLDTVNDYIRDLDDTMIDYVDIFDGYTDYGVFTYNLMDDIYIEALGEAPIFYGGNPYNLDITNHSIRYGNIVNVTLDKISVNFDNEYSNYFLYDSNSGEYFTNDFDTFALKNYLRYVLYEGFAIDEAEINYKAETEENYLNGITAGDYYISLTDTYEMRTALGIQEGVDGWLDSVGLTDSTAKVFVSVIIIIGFTILLFVLKANFVTILIVDFGVIGLLALLGFIPLWIILFIIILLMVMIFFKRGE